MTDLLSKVLLWLAAFLFIGAAVILVVALTRQSRNNAKPLKHAPHASQKPDERLESR